MMTSSWKFTSKILEGLGLMTNDDERGRKVKIYIIYERPLRANIIRFWDR